MALNAKMKQNRTLNVELSDVVALNTEWRCGSERQAKMWLWTPNEVKHDFERRTKISSGSEHQNETKQGAECWNEWRSGSERRMKMQL